MNRPFSLPIRSESIRRECLLRAGLVTAGGSATAALESRIAALEENERRQAELVTNIAEQLAQMTVAVTALHRHTRRLLFGQLCAVAIAVIAILMALR